MLNIINKTLKALTCFFFTIIWGLNIHAHPQNKQEQNPLINISVEQMVENLYSYEIYWLWKHLNDGSYKPNHEEKIAQMLEQIKGLTSKEKASFTKKVKAAFLFPQKNECYLLAADRRLLESQRHSIRH